MTLFSLVADVRTFLSPKSINPQSVPPNENTRPYLYGLRGFLALSGIFTVFFQTFVPSLVWKNTNDASYQNILRIVLSPIVWDESFIASFFLVLSSHSIALRFLDNPTPSTCAGSVIRRVIRMIPPIALASGISSGIFSAAGTKYISHFEEMLPNTHMQAPQVPEDGLAAANAIFSMFWAVRGYYSQAANAFWPTATIWNVSLIFNQSWTVYFLMIILPYTRPSWHAGALSLFSLGSFWVCSWGWYSAAALFLADFTTNPHLRRQFDEGISVSKRFDWKLPYNLAGGAMVVAGYAMKFTWTVLPNLYHKELILHPFLHLSEKTSVVYFAAADPYPRVDNFLAIFGILILLENSVILKRCLSCKPLVFLGKRSLSIFVAQSLVFWTVGIKLYVHLLDQGSVSSSLAKLAVFAASSVTTILCAEAYHRIVDVPSQLWQEKHSHGCYVESIW